jgi:hypothetical protein
MNQFRGSEMRRAVALLTALGLLGSGAAELMETPGTSQPSDLIRGEVHRIKTVGEMEQAIETANQQKTATTFLLEDGTYVLDVPALDIQCPGLVIRSAGGLTAAYWTAFWA